MRISSVRFSETVSKNYQSRKFEVEISVGPDEDPGEAIDLAKRIVDRELRGGPRVDAARVAKAAADEIARQCAESELALAKVMRGGPNGAGLEPNQDAAPRSWGK